jgi:DNA-binding MarR family transcriptional regulator
MSREVSSDWSQVAVFASAVDAGLGKWLTDRHGIGLTEYRAITYLSLAPDKELRVNDLALRVGLNQSSVTRLVSRLEVKGLAQRDVCAEDGRGVYAVMSERGEMLLREARTAYEEQVRELLQNATAHFPQLDVRRLGQALTDIGSLVSS